VLYTRCCGITRAYLHTRSPTHARPHLEVSSFTDTANQTTVEVRSNYRNPQSIFGLKPVVSQLEPHSNPLPGVGSVIDGYHLVEMIGEGGMGEVYLAEQFDPVRRRVAIKLIKPGMDSRSVIARFDSERQALAMLEHPAIAKIFDAGTTTCGKPYLVMEYVGGESIVRFADRLGLTVRERVRMFCEVCDAVEHAHARGIIHRDLKPSNILGVEIDGGYTAKIIDFGIAKIFYPLGDTGYRFETVADQRIGTRSSMSPEQLRGNGEIDERTDVYGLGVLLFELLAGTHPFATVDNDELLDDSFCERVCDGIRPSLASAFRNRSAGDRSEFATRRGSSPPQLEKQLAGALDWITRRSMRADRLERYLDVREFRSDLLGYLSGNALIAGPPTVSYRAKKWVGRHRGPLISCAILLTLLVIGLADTTRVAFQARREADTAWNAVEEARKSRDLLRTQVEELQALRDERPSEADVAPVGVGTDVYTGDSPE